jgi:hypothetical protein
MTATQVAAFPADKVRALTGMTPDALETLLARVAPELVARRLKAQADQQHRKRRVGGGRTRRLSPQQEILLTLVYLRHNVAHCIVGQLFGVSADTSENTFAEVVLVLCDTCPSGHFDAHKKWKKSEPSWHPDTLDKVLIDSFETPVPRPSDNEMQRRLYSGKKKRHTLKSQVVTDSAGEILEVSGGYRGPLSDKKVYEQSGVSGRYKEAVKQGDLGYQGVEGVGVPHKKPKGGMLSEEQKGENRVFSASRVRVEHGIRRIKGFRVVRDEFRLASGLFASVLSGVVGLVQLNRLFP